MSQKSPKMTCKQMSEAVFQQNFIYRRWNLNFIYFTHATEHSSGCFQPFKNVRLFLVHRLYKNGGGRTGPQTSWLTPRCRVRDFPTCSPICRAWNVLPAEATAVWLCGGCRCCLDSSTPLTFTRQIPTRVLVQGPQALKEERHGSSLQFSVVREDAQGCS